MQVHFFALMKVTICPQCRGQDIDMYIANFQVYRCNACGYVGGLVIEDEVTLGDSDNDGLN